ALFVLAACSGDPSSSEDDVILIDSAIDDTGDDAADTSDDSGTPDAAADVEIDIEADVESDAEPDGSGEPVPCADDQCDIEGVCFDNETANPDNSCELCLVVVSRDGWSFDDSMACDDGDACTSADTCFEGACTGTVAVCANIDSCNAAECQPETGECVAIALSDVPCDDGDRCTTNAMCTAGVCGSGDAVTCDDGNTCTADSCDPTAGCVSAPADGLACDDGELCTTGDMCSGGVCVAGSTPLDCDDSSLCTLDRCVPGVGCENLSIADRCSDENPCTDEVCDPLQGCVFPFNTAPCTDGTVCTEGDVCAEGVCVGSPVLVDDGNNCTDESCDPVTGVSVVPNMDACDDNNVCTIGDMCTGGGCVAGTEELACGDENVCTDELCDPVLGCVSTPNTATCDDGFSCTINDQCSDGGCAGERIVCDDGNDCTVGRCDEAAGCVFDVVLTNACRPTIAIDYPPRGATIDSDDGALLIRGSVISGAGDITSFTMNGRDISVNEDGTFVVPEFPDFGGNVLVFEAEDELGSPRKRVQSYVWANQYVVPDAANTGTRSNPGLGIRLGVESFPVLDSIFETVLENFDLSAALGNGVIFSFAGVDITPATSNAVVPGDITVLVRPRTGGLRFTADLAAGGSNFVANLRANGFLCTGAVTFTAGTVTLSADINLSVVNNEPVATFANVVADVSNTNINIGCALGGLAAALLPDVDGDIEDLLEDAVGDQFGPVISDAFGAFAISADIPLPSLAGGDPVNITLATDYSAINSSATGSDFILRAGATAPERLTPYTNLGSMRRNQCGTGSQTMIFNNDEGFELALADDVVNELLYSAWAGGFLEFDIPPALLGDFDIPGVEDLVLVASGLLQPVASDCDNIDGPLIATIGDLRIDASLNLFGQPLNLIIYVAVDAEIDITAADGQLGFGFGSLDNAQFEVNVVQESAIAAEATFEALLADQLVPGLEAALGGGALGGFPLPTIDLSEAVGGDEPLLLTINPREVIRRAGNTLILGTLE
ncbi:MAG: hypothetical protein ACI82G_000418, partial [Bradymonadia bacterium]